MPSLLLLSPWLFQRPLVRPSSFTLEATTMPVEPNTDITGTCVVNDIRPEPADFYWMLDDTRIDSSNITSVVNDTNGVVNIYITFNYVVVADDDDSLLTCVLAMQNGDTLTRNLRINIMKEKGICIFSVIAWLPWEQGSWDQHGACLGPTGPRWAPCWSHELCYLVTFTNRCEIGTL